MSDVVGTTIGDYRVDAVIGAGRTGEVYRVSHVKFDTVQLALRVFTPAIAEARGFKTRFFEYAQGAGALVHPHVVRLRDAAEDDRRWFLAMDLMSGATLQSMRPGSAVTEWLAAAWPLVDAIRQAAEGVAAGHAAGLVHGGIHLGNLFVTDAAGTAPQIKVGDLGIAMVAADDSDAPSKDKDVFALGCALYALTTGRDAFPKDAARFASGGNAAFVPPKRLVRGFPDALDTIVSRALATDPRDRFESCAAFAAALRDSVVVAGLTAPGRAVPAGAASGSGAANLLEATVTMPAAKQAPPARPQPSIKPGSQSVPRVHVLDGSGNRIDREFVRNSGLRIGRGEGNDIILKSSAISQEHARIDWLDNRVTITDLGSTNNTLVAGQRLMPQVPHEWEEQWVQIGPYWLWLETPPPEYDDRIEIRLDQRSRAMTITPGKPVTCRVTLSNQTDKIQQVELSVDGIPSQWVEGTRTRHHLPLVEQRDADLVISVPRTPEGRAGTYTVTVRVHSTTDPTLKPGAATATWTVEPFEATKVMMAPAKASGMRSAVYSLTLLNNGNRDVTYVITGSDSDRKLEYSLSAEGYPSTSRLSIEVPHGERLDVRAQVLATRRWFGSSAPHNFTLQAQPADGQQEVKVEGHFLHRAVFPVWAIALAPVLIIGLIMLLPWLMRPQVRTVYLDPVNPEIGATFTVHWDAQRARRVRVFLNEVPVQPDPDAEAGMLVIPNGVRKDGTVRVVVSNFFGQATASVPISTNPIEVQLPLLEATVEPREVAPGGEVKVSWSASRAERVEFSHRGNVPLTGEYTDHPTQAQTYVITAYNSAGQTTKQTFQVQVRKPTPLSSSVRLTAHSRDFKKGRRNLEINQGRYVFFDWEAKNAVSVRLEGGGQPLTLAGTSGNSRRAQLRGKGHYTFQLIATSETGEEVRSQPVEIDVTCTAFQTATKRCNGTPEVRW
jgi:serine/threonine protein kinase